MVTLIKLTENDKRLIIALILIIVLLFFIIGCIVRVVKKTMQNQSKRADKMLHDVIEAKIFLKERQLIKFGIRKNWRVFFKQARIPFCIMLGATAVILIYCITMNNWHVNLFDNAEEGIGTLFHTFKWNETPTTKFFGITIVSDWPPLAYPPHWSWKAWGAYIFVPAMLTGTIWFLICVQAYIARSFRIRKIAKNVFNRPIDNIDQKDVPISPIKPE